MDDEFMNQLDRPPVQQWEHNPNPLVGKEVFRYTFKGEYDPVEIIGILPEGAELVYSVLCGRATLRSFIEEKDPKVGDIVGIKHAGTAISKKTGKTYELYNCAVRPASAEPPLKPDEGDDELGF